MIDAKKFLLEKLNTVSAPVVYELFINENTTFPCISYIQAGDDSLYSGDTLNVANISFLIKVYSRTVSELESIAHEVDMALKGWRRSGGNETVLNNIIIKNLIYTVDGIERLGG